MAEQDDAASDVGDALDAKNWRTMIQEQNRKNKKSGGFQAMGLTPSVFRGIFKKGYKVPTPIQRKSIPLIMEGKDVVAMARTGSGKTAAFCIPMFEKLKQHAPDRSPRALILSPTRELALQTHGFVRDLSRFTNLTATMVLGGDRMEDQFEAMHQKPDILVATPGRLMHVLVEMNLKLNFIEYCVFDEADRLFEMGFEEQLREIIHRMPPARQTLMFSATLPKSVVEFAKAGLSDPTLIRLDVDNKLSEHLRLAFLACRDVDKPAVLLNLLRTILRPNELSVVFAATKHHVEYLKDLLTQAKIPCTCIYSSLDPAARKINLEKFRRRRCQVMVVTDIAARGVDIPELDNVINYHFPSKGKLFVHRVGRVARAGRTGQAYSLIAGDELPYLLDLHLFLGRPVNLAHAGSSPVDDSVYGAVPQTVVDEEEDFMRTWHQESEDLRGMVKVCDNAYKKYLQTRPAAASESISRCKKEFRDARLGVHPIFRNRTSDLESERMKLLDGLRCYKSHSTIFELGGQHKSEAFQIMQAKRKLHQKTIAKEKSRSAAAIPTLRTETGNHQETAVDDELQGAFRSVISSKPPTKPFERKPKKPEPFIPYAPVGNYAEKGLELDKRNFALEAQGAMIDINTDEADDMMKNKNRTKWDRKRKKFVREDDSKQKNKKIRTESGAWIPATYKTDLYDQWKKAYQVDYNDDKNVSDDDQPAQSRDLRKINRSLGSGRMKYMKTQMQAKQMSKDKRKFKPGGSRQIGLKSKDQIAKGREQRKSQMEFQTKRREVNEKKKAAHGKSDKKQRKR